MRHKLRIPALVAICALLLAVGDTGIAQASPKSKAHTPPLTTINFVEPVAAYTISTVFIQFAIAQGYFRKQGIQVNVILSTNPLTVLLSGSAQIANTDMATATLSINAGSGIKMFDMPFAKQSGGIIANSPITTLAQLQGATYGISAPGGSTQTDIQAEMREAGLNPNTLNFVSLGAPANRVLALVEGKIQATDVTYLTDAPILAGIKNGTIHVLELDSKGLPNLPLSADMATSSYIASHQKLLQRFVYAETQGLIWAQLNPNKAAQVALPFIPGTSLSLMENGMQHLSANHDYGIAGINTQLMNRIQNSLTKLGDIPHPDSVSQVANVAISEAVNKKLLGGLSQAKLFTLLGTTNTSASAQNT